MDDLDCRSTIRGWTVGPGQAHATVLTPVAARIRWTVTKMSEPGADTLDIDDRGEVLETLLERDPKELAGDKDRPEVAARSRVYAVVAVARPSGVHGEGAGVNQFIDPRDAQFRDHGRRARHLKQFSRHRRAYLVERAYRYDAGHDLFEQRRISLLGQVEHRGLFVISDRALDAREHVVDVERGFGAKGFANRRKAIRHPWQGGASASMLGHEYDFTCLEPTSGTHKKRNQACSTSGMKRNWRKMRIHKASLPVLTSSAWRMY